MAPQLRPLITFVLLIASAALQGQLTHQNIVHNAAGTTASIVNGVASDADGNLFITGWRTDAIDFGGTAHPQGNGAIFLAKFDPQGNELWNKVSGSADAAGNHKGMGVAVDGEGNIYNAGWLFVAQAATFDGTTLPAGSFGFVAKYSANGTLLWVQGQVGGVNAIAIDGNGNPFINLGDASIEKLDPATGNSIASATGSGDLMNVLYHNITIDANNNVIAQWGNKITKYDSALNEIWSRPLVKPSLAESFRASVDSNGDVWATFYAIFGTVSLGGVDYTSFPAGYIYKLSGDDGSVLSCASPGAYKVKKVFANGAGELLASGDFAFNTPGMVKYDAGLTAMWSLTSFDAKDIVEIGEECFVLGGQHSANVTLDGTTYTRPNGSGQENAIAGYLCAGAVDVDEVQRTGIVDVYPNPAADRLNITLRTRTRLDIHDLTGALLRSERLNAGCNAIDLNELPNGLLLLRDPSGSGAVRVVHED